MKKSAALPLYFLFVLFAIVPNAEAEWQWGDGIIYDITDIKDEVLGPDGNVKQVIGDLKGQLEDATAKGLILKESIGGILDWMHGRVIFYQDFVGFDSGHPKCAADYTPCGEFRADLKNFFTDFAAQRVNFPVIDRFGVGDGSHAVSIIEKLPPILLFALHQTINRVPDWQSMPLVLQDIFDEVGSLGVFTDNILAPTSLRIAPLDTKTVAPFAIFPTAPTQEFCTEQAWFIERQMDPVRMNRLKFVVFTLRQILGLWEGLTHETVGGDVVGEGSDSVVPNPMKAYLKIAVAVFDIVQRGVETFQENLDICRKKNSEMEIQLAQCTPLVSTKMPGTRDEIYNFTWTKLLSAEAEGLVTSLSKEHWFCNAKKARAAGDYNAAFNDLCKAYQNIGASIFPRGGTCDVPLP